MNRTNLILEACVESLDEAIFAEKSGADRIELCGDLSVGGVTPSVELTLACLESLSIPIMAMVRPRGGDFVYSPSEIEEMKKSISFFKHAGVAGVVFGVLDRENQVDLEITRELTAYATPLLVTFHKAIDETPNPVESIEKLIQITGIQRVLTSGGAETAKNGAGVLRNMKMATGGQITILAAGKVTKDNLEEIHDLVGTTEYHGKRIVF